MWLTGHDVGRQLCLFRTLGPRAHMLLLALPCLGQTSLYIILDFLSVKLLFTFCIFVYACIFAFYA